MTTTALYGDVAEYEEYLRRVAALYGEDVPTGGARKGILDFVKKYSEDQPRDDHGRFSFVEGGGAASEPLSTDRPIESGGGAAEPDITPRPFGTSRYLRQEVFNGEAEDMKFAYAHKKNFHFLDLGVDLIGMDAGQRYENVLARALGVQAAAHDAGDEIDARAAGFIAEKMMDRLASEDVYGNDGLQYAARVIGDIAFAVEMIDAEKVAKRAETTMADFEQSSPRDRAQRWGTDSANEIAARAIEGMLETASLHGASENSEHYDKAADRWAIESAEESVRAFEEAKPPEPRGFHAERPREPVEPEVVAAGEPDEPDRGEFDDDEEGKKLYHEALVEYDKRKATYEDAKKEYHEQYYEYSNAKAAFDEERNKYHEEVEEYDDWIRDHQGGPLMSWVGSSQNAISKWGDKLDKLFNSAPNWEGTLVRGVDHPVSWNEGDVVQFNNFKSASANQEVAKDFARLRSAGLEEGGTIMVVRAKTGIELRRSSLAGVGEEEIVIRKGARARVVQHTKIGRHSVVFMDEVVEDEEQEKAA